MEFTMQRIESIQSKKRKVKKEVKDKLLELTEVMSEDDCIDVDGQDDLVCIIDSAKTKAKSKMRK